MRYLFCSFTTPGFLYPLLGLSLELRARAHQVAFATGPAAGPELERHGLERIPRGASDGESFNVRLWGLPAGVALDVKHAEHAVRRFRPDVLVTHALCMAPLLVRERLGIPAVVLGLAGYLWPAGARDPGISLSDAARRREHLDEHLAILERARAAFGLSARGAEDGALPLLGDAFLLRTISALEPALKYLPAPVQAVGACLWEPADAGGGDDDTPAGDAPLVYVQHGRTFGEAGFWEPLVEALAGEPVRVAASVGRMDVLPAAAPAHFRIRSHVSMMRVLPRAAAMVSGGASASVLGALSHGVPAVLVPSGGEGPPLSDRVVRARCAVRVEPRDATPTILRDAIRRVLEDEELRAGARRMADAFAAVPGFGAAANAVERVSRVKLLSGEAA